MLASSLLLNDNNHARQMLMIQIIKLLPTEWRDGLPSDHYWPAATPVESLCADDQLEWCWTWIRNLLVSSSLHRRSSSRNSAASPLSVWLQMKMVWGLVKSSQKSFIDGNTDLRTSDNLQDNSVESIMCLSGRMKEAKMWYRVSLGPEVPLWTPVRLSDSRS